MWGSRVEAGKRGFRLLALRGGPLPVGQGAFLCFFRQGAGGGLFARAAQKAPLLAPRHPLPPPLSLNEKRWGGAVFALKATEQAMKRVGAGKAFMRPSFLVWGGPAGGEFFVRGRGNHKGRPLLVPHPPHSFFLNKAVISGYAVPSAEQQSTKGPLWGRKTGHAANEHNKFAVSVQSPLRGGDRGRQPGRGPRQHHRAQPDQRRLCRAGYARVRRAGHFRGAYL